MTSVVTAFTAVGALVFTGLSLRATQTQIEIAEQGQITDRYTKAVSQLDATGPEHLQGRLGAIYALERLARDSPRDQPTIIEILSAFIRGTRTPVPADLDPLPLSADMKPSINPSPGTAPCLQNDLTTDARAALTVLGRRNTSQDNATVVDLSQTCFAGVNLVSMKLDGITFTGAEFANAHLNFADLNHANLTRAHFAGADLNGTRLVGSTLEGAHLQGTYLNGADLVGADLKDANLQGAMLRVADLEHANFQHADLHEAQLGSAFLKDAQLDDAHLNRADLDDATLTGANLEKRRPHIREPQRHQSWRRGPQPRKPHGCQARRQDRDHERTYGPHDGDLVVNRTATEVGDTIR